MKKIHDETKIRNSVYDEIRTLHEFAKNLKLYNIQYRCEIILEKMDSGHDLYNLNGSMNNLKTDLIADIIGPECYPLLNLSKITYISSPGYKVAYSIIKLDEHIFGNASQKGPSHKPLSLTIPQSYYTILNRAEKTTMKDLQSLKACIENNDYSHTTVFLALGIFRSMHDTIIEATKKYVEELDAQINGEFDREFWEFFLSYDHMFEKKPDKNGKIILISDFNTIGGAASHSRAINNEDGTITIEPIPNEFVNKSYIYTFKELILMIFAEYQKIMYYFPALMQIEVIANYKFRYEE